MFKFKADHRVVPDGAGHPANPSPFLGGEVRQFGPGKLAHIAIVGEGAAFKDDKAVAIQAVLAQLIGKTGSNILKNILNKKFFSWLFPIFDYFMYFLLKMKIGFLDDTITHFLFVGNFIFEEYFS